MDNQIAYLIKQHRKSQGLSQQELAEKAGISRSALIKYENQQQEPSIQALAKIAAALNVNTLSLLGKENKAKIKMYIDKVSAFENLLEALGYKIEGYDLGKEENTQYFKIIILQIVENVISKRKIPSIKMGQISLPPYYKEHIASSLTISSAIARILFIFCTQSI